MGLSFSFAAPLLLMGTTLLHKIKSHSYLMRSIVGVAFVMFLITPSQLLGVLASLIVFGLLVISVCYLFYRLIVLVLCFFSERCLFETVTPAEVEIPVVGNVRTPAEGAAAEGAPYERASAEGTAAEGAPDERASAEGAPTSPEEAEDDNTYNGFVLMVGLDGESKTTILDKLQPGEIATTNTAGFIVKTVKYKNTSFTLLDINGQDMILPLWRHYFKSTVGLIFVVDGNDRGEVVNVRNELHRILDEDELRDVVLLVLVNKKDLRSAMNEAEITHLLGLQSLRQHHCYVQSTCANCGDGVHDGLDWLSDKIDKSKCMTDWTGFPTN